MPPLVDTASPIGNTSFIPKLSSEQRKKYAVFSSTMPSTALPSIGRDEESFIWSMKSEPHFSRRREILKKHPEIQKLFGHEPLTKYIVVGLVALQIACAYSMRSPDSYASWPFWICGTTNQSLFLAIHELSHNLGFKSIRANKLFSILVSNVPIAVPYAASFKPYHMDHHKYQGVEGVDTDLPTDLEARLFSTRLGKFFFATFQVVFYAIRPMVVKVQPLTAYHLLNVVYILLWDLMMISCWGWGSIIYLLVSTLIAGSGLHPCAAHFIAEHYVFTGDWETYSYYGWLNFFCFNVGLHNEHHDFPNIPWSRLRALNHIAHEFYDHLPYHESWPLVTYKFIMEDHVGVWNRVKRTKKVKTAENSE